MDLIDNLREHVARFDASIKGLVAEDPGVRMEAILDAAALLSAAKLVAQDEWTREREPVRSGE